MQVLLRHLISGHFLTPDGRWSSEKARARNFPSTAVAIDEVRKMDLTAVEVMLVFDTESDLASSA